MALVKKRVLVHTKDGKTYEGYLVKRRPELILELVDLIEPEPQDASQTQKIELKGKVVIPRENVHIYQVL